MNPQNATTLSRDAATILQLLTPEGQTMILGQLSHEQDPVSGEAVLHAIGSCGSRVRDLLPLVRRELRFAVEVESSPHDGRVRRNAEDILRGIRRAAFCLQLGSELLDGR